MRITQGAFSFLPDLTDEEIRKQLEYCLNNGWPINVEFTDDPHPRNSYWEMWDLPMFDLKDAAAIMSEINACRQAYPIHDPQLCDGKAGRAAVSGCSAEWKRPG